jgi:hypothetical protein
VKVVSDNGNGFEVDLTELPSGVYVMNVTDNQVIRNIRLIKQ